MLREKLQKLEASIAKDAYDLSAWQGLFAEAQKLSIAEAREYYEKFLVQFPTAARYWRLYIDHEKQNKNYAQVVELFQRCLIPCSDVALYKSYLQYMNETKKGDPTYRDEILKAYQFVVDQVGNDFSSTDIWKDYIEFLKREDPATTYEEGQKITDVRRASQLAVKVPKQSIDHIWRDYSEYEQSVNKTIAKKVMDDCSKSYMTARRVSRDIEHKFRDINRGQLARPPRGNKEENQQLRRWLSYIDWEKKNPMGYEGKETVNIITRVRYAYKLALLCLRHYERLWIDATSYLGDEAKLAQAAGDSNAAEQLESAATAMFEEACAFLPTSTLIAFAFADHSEMRGKQDQTNAIYERLLQRDDVDTTLVFVQYMRAARRTGGEKEFRSIFSRARQDRRCSHYVYIASALMELSGAKNAETVCQRVFELGLKKHPADPKYVLRYLEHLFNKTDQSNARVLFERVLEEMEPVTARPIWDRFHAFETLYGDLTQITTVETRQSEKYPEIYQAQPSRHLVGRFKFMDLLPCSEHALATMGLAHDPFLTGGGMLPSGAGGAKAKDSHADRGVEDDADADSTPFFLPDTSQLLPFRPNPESPAGLAYPETVLELLTQLPSPANYVSDKPRRLRVDALMREIQTRHIPVPSVAGSETAGALDVDSSRKRKRGDNSTDKVASTTVAAPADVYLSRQRQKLQQAL
eukprot:m.372340 g.372340  ORF g.372340 m.372340 type:complete len:694 (+) comp20871_c0_seq1:257-2338(+)